MLKNKICIELNEHLKMKQKSILPIIETPVRDDYSTNVRHKKLQETIKEINEIKKQIYDKCY
jgi:hypothetical protein